LGRSNITVDITKADISSIKAVITQLRVPELNYSHQSLVENSSSLKSDGQQSERALIEDRVLKSLTSVQYDAQTSLIKTMQTSNQFCPVSPELNNIAFIVDRIWAVWLRKCNLSVTLKSILGRWRLPLFQLMYSQFTNGYSSEETELSLRPLIQIVNTLAEDNLGWCDKPLRSRDALLNEISVLTETVLDQENLGADELTILGNQWEQFVIKQKEKFSKVTERLISLEKLKSWQQLCAWFSQGYIGLFFPRYKLPKSLHQFIKEYWGIVLSNHVEWFIEEGDSSLRFDEKIGSLNRNIVIAFTKKNEEAFKLADHILEDLQGVVDESKVSVPQDMWMSLELSLVSQLQGTEEEKYKFEPGSLSDHLSEIFGEFSLSSIKKSNFSDSTFSLGDWFVIKVDGEGSPLKLIASFEDSNTYLFCNYLGIKVAEFSHFTLEHMLEQGEIIPLTLGASFNEVFKSTVKGLLKVAETQKLARINAAEKAKAEAESLLAEKLRAEELAVAKAEEIAKRAQLLKQKREERVHYEKELKVREHVAKFKLGAWISIKEETGDARFKLVVKLVALGKYIFVDRLGIKKREFLEDYLVTNIMSENIEVISDGAEFEDSLERVVSRLRTSK